MPGTALTQSHSWYRGTLPASRAGCYSALCALRNVLIPISRAHAFTPMLIRRSVVTQWSLVPQTTFSEYDRLPIFYHCVRCVLSMSAGESLLETHVSLSMLSRTQVCFVLS